MAARAAGCGRFSAVHIDHTGSPPVVRRLVAVVHTRPQLGVEETTAYVRFAALAD
jgi:hypothetical protein